MKIKNIILSTIMVVALMSSCTENGEPINSKEAAVVNTVKTKGTNTFNKIIEGSYLDWKAAHIGGVNKRQGKIYYKEATLLVNKDKVTNASFVVDMSTLIVNGMEADEAEELGNHLKNADFFHIEKYPTSKFELTNIETLQGEYNSKVTGNLTILGLAKSISFDANINVGINEVSIVSENFSIDRSDWGLTYHNEGSKGVPLDYLISDDIGFHINVTIGK